VLTATACHNEDMADDLLTLTERGLYCPAGDFHVDPWLPVPSAIITHGHADHARRGSEHYLGARAGKHVLRTRLGEQARISTLPYGEVVEHEGVRVSLHPAGHVLGSAQVRIEHKGQVWVVSGDYKLQPDPTCALFEPLRCHVFVSESTFGLPIYRWPDQAEVFADVNAWWRGNQEAGKASLLFGYALGKAQRLLAGLDPSIGPIYLHGAVARLVKDYRAAGVTLPPCTPVGEAPAGTRWDRALIVAPPSTHGTPWVRKFGQVSTALASGWMRIRGTRRRRAVDRGFVLSDHADWPGLLSAIKATGAERVWVTHGYVAVLVRYLREHGVEAVGLETRFEGERIDATEEEEVLAS
jgi:putative mRNA 3-end processing factor